MKPIQIITANDPQGHIPIEFPDHTGIEPFTLPVISLVDVTTMNKVDKWMHAENEKRTQTEPKKSPVTNYEMCERLLKELVDATTAKKVLARPMGERVQIWNAWLEATIDPETTVGESSDS